MCLAILITLCSLPSYAYTTRYYWVGLQQGPPWKRLMDGIGVTLKNLVYRRVLSWDAVINTLRVWKSNQQRWLFVLQKIRIFSRARRNTKSHANTVNIEISQGHFFCDGSHSFSNHYFKSSEDLEPFPVQKYDIKCGHSVNNVNDKSLCNSCYKRYILGEE